MFCLLVELGYVGRRKRGQEEGGRWGVGGGEGVGKEGKMGQVASNRPDPPGGW